MDQTTKERIKAHTYPDPNSGCLIHDFSPKNKYGHCSIWFNGKNRNLYRLVYEDAFGPIPNGLQVNHKCSNPYCCNPEHLYLGTQLDNMRDRQKLNRYTGLNSGESNPQCKLTDMQVDEIRKDSRKYKEISKDYNVSRSMISLIKNNKRRMYGGSMHTDGES